MLSGHTGFLSLNKTFALLVSGEMLDVSFPREETLLCYVLLCTSKVNDFDL